MGILGILLWGCDRENSRDGEDDHIKLGGGGGDMGGSHAGVWLDGIGGAIMGKGGAYGVWWGRIGR